MNERVPNPHSSGVLRYIVDRASTIVLLGCMTVPLFYMLWDNYQVDFRAFYVAAISSAHHLNPYADNSQYGECFIDPINHVASSRWVYPPSALFFIAPFGKLSYTSARLLFGLLSLASLSWMLLYLSGRFQVADSWAIVSFVSLPVMACIERGQIDLLILFLVVLTYAGGRRFWAGVPLGVAIAIKVFPGAILLWLLIQRRFRMAATAISVALTIFTLSLWRYGIAGYSEFRENLASLSPQPARPLDLLHKPASSLAGDRWLAFTHSFIGSYNNPLVLFEPAGIALGVCFVILAAFWLRHKRVSSETGFFTMVLISQCINTRLWTMGMVMYLPACLVAIGKTRSTFLRALLLVPLFLPSQVRILGVSPRFVIAIAVLAYLIHKGLDEKGLDQSEDSMGDRAASLRDSIDAPSATAYSG